MGFYLKYGARSMSDDSKFVTGSGYLTDSIVRLSY